MINTEVNAFRLEEEFYSKYQYFSYSAINKLLYSPRLFYSHYILGEREDRLESHLIEGKVIHCLLLDREKFDDQFMISPDKLPTDNSKLVIDKLYQYHLQQVKEGMSSEYATIDSYTDAILNILVDINLHQSLANDKKPDADGIQKTGDEKRLEKIITPLTESYFEFLKVKDKKDIIDMDTYNKCMDIVNLFEADPKVRQLLNLDEDGRVTFNEHPLKFESAKYGFGFKGIVDNFSIDFAHRKIYINDIKTTSKSIEKFPETVEYYRYSIQACMYIKLVSWFIENQFDVEVDGTWTVEFNFIVVDPYKQIYSYKVSDETMNKWLDEFAQILVKVEWHYKSKRYDLPYVLAVENLTL